MESISLSVTQRLILSTVIDLYEAYGDPANGEVIAETLDRAAGTIRNQMQQLRELNLVESVAGPHGGYKPTSVAYDVLGYDDIENPSVVPVTRNGNVVNGVNVEAIDLINVDHPDHCRAELRVRGSLRTFHTGDKLRIGPTPTTNLIIQGRIDGKDQSNRRIIMDIDEMIVE